MLTVRLARFGTKKVPYYHIVVTDSEYRRDGKFFEQLGTYDPRKPIDEVRLDLGRLAYWEKVGARPSTRVAHVIRDWRKSPTGQAAAAAAQSTKS